MLEHAIWELEHNFISGEKKGKAFKDHERSRRRRNLKQYNLESLFEELSKLKIHDLSQPLFDGVPVHQADPPFVSAPYRSHEGTAKYFEEGFAYALELIVTSMHSGTHIDAPCHMSKGGRLFGDIPVEEVSKSQNHGQFSRLGIDEFPLEIRRGVLLDVAGLKQLDLLPASYEITEDDLESCLKVAAISIRPGDAVLVRTGYGPLFSKAPDRYLNSHPGLGGESALWLAERRAALVGTDNLSLDATPTKTYPAHTELLIRRGIYTIKNLNLESLASDGASEFLFVALPLKFLGGTGSLIRPLALSEARQPHKKE